MRTFVKGLIVLVAITLPLFGAWLASSLAAYANGPRWILLPVALLGFPLLPLLWEAVAGWRRARARYAKPRILSFSDRLWLRTTTLNLLFVGGLLALGPGAATRALSARGDWLLDGAEGRLAERGRSTLHVLAGALDALLRVGHENPYDEDPTRAVPSQTDKTPAPMPRGGEVQEVASTPTPEPAPAPEPERAAAPPAPLDAEHVWPRPPTLHPLVAAMQPVDEPSIDAVAAYVVAHEPSKLGQLQALHDWVADRIAYDPAALTGVRPPQTAQAVFTRRNAVCAGYADLLVALGKAAKLQIVYVVGDARGANGEVDGAGHAWNVATVDGISYLLDATWDAGYLEGSPARFVKHFQTEYSFTPPAIFGIDHFPEQASEQLRTPSISRGDFMRLPQMRPSFFALGLELREPNRSQVTVAGALDVTLGVPSGTYVLATFEPKGGGASTRCEVSGTDTVHVRCAFPGRGEYRVQLYAALQRYGSYDFVGELLAQDAR